MRSPVPQAPPASPGTQAPRAIPGSAPGSAEQGPGMVGASAASSVEGAGPAQGCDGTPPGTWVWAPDSAHKHQKLRVRFYFHVLTTRRSAAPAWRGCGGPWVHAEPGMQEKFCVFSCKGSGARAISRWGFCISVCGARGARGNYSKPQGPERASCVLVKKDACPRMVSAGCRPDGGPRSGSRSQGREFAPTWKAPRV